MSLLNNIFNEDDIEINSVNGSYLKITGIIFLLLIGLFIIKKDYYYENSYITSDNTVILQVEKRVIDDVKNKKDILLNDIKNTYSINKIIDRRNICYLDIKISLGMENISNGKYKILLGKETVFEYFIRVIKKVL